MERIKRRDLITVTMMIWAAAIVANAVMIYFNIADQYPIAVALVRVLFSLTVVSAIITIIQQYIIHKINMELLRGVSIAGMIGSTGFMTMIGTFDLPDVYIRTTMFVVVAFMSIFAISLITQGRTDTSEVEQKHD